MGDERAQYRHTWYAVIHISNLADFNLILRSVN